MKPFLLPANLPPDTARDIVAEVGREMVEASAGIMGPNSIAAILLKRGNECKWNCRIFKLKGGRLLLIENKENVA